MANPVLQKLGIGFLRFVSSINAIASFWYFMIMIVVVGDVIGRAFFNSPITGTPEIVKISIVGMFFMHLPQAVWSGQLIRSEFILNRLRSSTKAVLNAVYDLLSAIFLLLLFLSTLSDTITAWRILDYEGEGALRVPTYPVYTLILIGCMLGSALFATRFIRGVRNLRDGRQGS